MESKIRIPWNKNFKSVCCRSCKKIFQTPQWKINQGRGVFCSKKCSLFFKKEKHQKLQCIHCGRRFIIKLLDYQRGRGRFCSTKCSQAYCKKDKHPCWKGRFKKKCYICKKIFLLPLARMKTRTTCSKECYKIHLAKTTSGKNSHMWLGGKSREPYPITFNNLLKKQIRERDKCCKLCGTKQQTKPLDVHHIDYIKDNISKDNLISLCRSCHTKTNTDREYWMKKFK